jgi:hypothetical protein
LIICCEGCSDGASLDISMSDEAAVILTFIFLLLWGVALRGVLLI